MNQSLERLFGPEERGFYRLFLEPDVDTRDETFTIRLVPDRSQKVQGPTVLVMVNDLNRLSEALTALRVNGYSRQFGEESHGVGLFETVPATVPEIIERLRAVQNRRDQRLTLIALHSTAADMENRLEALRTSDGVAIRRVGGAA